MNTLDFDVVVAGLIGFVIGVILMAIISRSNSGKKQAEQSQLQKEYDQYREKVNAHFAKTADAVDGLTKSYQQVFDHLSDGAQNLMDKKALQAQLEKRQGKAVTLAYLVDQEKGSTGKTSEVKQSSVVSQPEKKAADVPVHKPVENKASAAKNDLVNKSVVKADATETSKANNTLKPSTANKSKSEAVANAPKSGNEELKPVVGKVGQEGLASKETAETSVKSNVHIAAEKAGLKSAKSIVKDSEHETAIDAVKKHIKEEPKGKQP